MIVLLSVQMFDPDASTNSVIYQIVMHGKWLDLLYKAVLFWRSCTISPSHFLSKTISLISHDLIFAY